MSAENPRNVINPTMSVTVVTKTDEATAGSAPNRFRPKGTPIMPYDGNSCEIEEERSKFMCERDQHIYFAWKYPLGIFNFPVLDRY